METIYAFHRHFPLSKMIDVADLKEITYDDLRDALGAARAAKVLQCIKFVPNLHLEALATPVSAKVLRVSVFGVPAFTYARDVHGHAVDFLIAIARADTGRILTSETISVGFESMQKPVNIIALVTIDGW